MAYNQLPEVVTAGGTGVASTTAYAPLLGGTSSTSALQSISMGSSGKVLMSNGSSALPSWNSVNAWVLLNTQNITGVTRVFFTSLISATYTTYSLTYSNVSADSGTPLLILQASIDNGSTYINTGYQTGSVRVLYTSASYAGPTTQTNGIYITSASSASFQSQGQIFLHNVGNGGMLMASGNDSNGNFNQNIMGYGTMTATNAFQLLYGSQNITGNFSLYGIKEF